MVQCMSNVNQLWLERSLFVASPFRFLQMERLNPEEETWTDAIVRLFRCDCQPSAGGANVMQSVKPTRKIDVEPVNGAVEVRAHEVLRSRYEMSRKVHDNKEQAASDSLVDDVNRSEIVFSDQGPPKEEASNIPDAKIRQLQTTELRGRSRVACCGLFSGRSTLNSKAK